MMMMMDYVMRRRSTVGAAH